MTDKVIVVVGGCDGAQHSGRLLLGWLEVLDEILKRLNVFVTDNRFGGHNRRRRGHWRVEPLDGAGGGTDHRRAGQGHLPQGGGHRRVSGRGEVQPNGTGARTNLDHVRRLGHSLHRHASIFYGPRYLSDGGHHSMRLSTVTGSGQS